MKNEELARRAVACRHWQWAPGVLTLEEIMPPAITLGWDAARVLHADEGEAVRVCTVLGKIRDIHATALPDLSDPCTLGALLALVREAWGDPHLHVGRRIAGWGVWTSQSTPLPECVGKGDTEPEALVAALEAAP